MNAKPVTSFERHGRAVKTGKLLAGLPAITAQLLPGASDERIATWLESLGDVDRRRVALLCGLKPSRKPSDQTWALFVAAVRERAELASFETDVIS